MVVNAPQSNIVSAAELAVGVVAFAAVSAIHFVVNVVGFAIGARAAPV